ncbi:hypothetical protein ACHAXT_006852 [Thalassiosira profunda]
MRNLALALEVRHALPATGEGGVPRGHIVAVIPGAASDGLHIPPDHFDGGRSHSDADGPGDGDGLEGAESISPPAAFVVTSAGYVLAVDARDRIVWTVDLEKVVQDSNDEEDDELDDGHHESTEAPEERGEWFYAASFLQEHSPNADEDTSPMGMTLASEGGKHLTCLSRDGHVVSVSVDDTNALASKGGILEEGSECIGSFENGLEGGGWSPDGEVLALVTFAADEDEDEECEEGNEVETLGQESEARVPILMTMNDQYDILSEVRLDPCLAPNHSNDTHGASVDPNAISLCWRPDSSSLALSTMDADVNGKPLRRIRTYHRATLQLVSLSKEEDGSGRDVPNLLPVQPAWAPAGCSHCVGAIQSSRPLTAKTARGRPIAMQVAFMEPNGLRHRECKIHNTCGKAEREEVGGVAFNLEGDLLAVSSRVSSSENGGMQRGYGKVQLYHRSNYHWYLKHELRYDGAAGSVPAVVSALQVSDEDPYRLTVALDHQGNDGPLEWREYAFRWDSSTVHYCAKHSPGSSSVIAMAVDGKKLNFTPLDKAVVPPPMYAASIELPAPVVGIAKRPGFCGEEIREGRVEYVLTLSDGRLALLRSKCEGKCGESLVPGFHPPSILAIVDPFDSASEETVEDGLRLQGMALRHVTIIDADDESLTVAALSCPVATVGKPGLADHLVEMNISWSAEADDTSAGVFVTSSLPLEGRALRLVNWSDTAHSPGARGSALLELADGTLLEYSKGGVLESCEAGPLLEACPWVEAVYDAHGDALSAVNGMDDDRGPDDMPKRLVVGLSSRYRLYCGERLLSSASSSFAISLEHRFVAHVTIGSRPQLKFLSLSSLRDFDPLMGSDENMALEGYEPRSVERGARLVAIFPRKPSLVLQMPRGNLEAISPRALVLPYIMTKIQEGDFRTSLDLMRRQRVDMNLIVDLDPDNFLEKGGAEQFIGQIDKIDYINLFLSSLIDVDTTLWKYPVPSWIQTQRSERGVPNPTESESKVNRVCKKVRQVMLDAEKNGATPGGKAVQEGHYLLPILSTFAKESPPKLEEALSRIKNSAARAPSKQSKKKSVLLSDHVQSSVQYLAFLADYELIFNTAIGMYDFELAKAVARHSQMDPKLYLPMLKRWRELPEATARYEVDVKLKRYESALRHLVASGQEEDGVADSEHFAKCLSFVEQHGLHKLGLELFKSDSNNHRSIMISLGEKLLSDRKPEEALAVFLASNPRYLEGGKRASRACGDWQTYFACCAEDGDEIGSDHATAIAESISSKVCSMSEQRDNYASAATILLDYGGDVADAVDMLIAGHVWSEGRRIAHLRDRTDLAKKVVDGSVSYASTCVEDLAERASMFVKANERYAEVIVIRRDAIREAEEAGLDGLHHDDSASMFSMQSTASNTSLRSSASGSSVGSVGSVGSVASVSTVISVGATSTFSFTGEVDSMKHKSKFNRHLAGRDKKKKRHKKKGPNARRKKPGSEEELKDLLSTLEHTCPDDHYVEVICETITFLLRSDKQSMAILLYESYKEMESAVVQSQAARAERDANERLESEQKERKEGRLPNNFVEHPYEKRINSIRCKPLRESLQTVISLLT